MQSLIPKTIILLILPLFTTAQAPDMPRIFQMGENEDQYEALKEKYNYSLLDACNDDMESAFKGWIGMAKSLEEYAEEQNVDINGVRAWLHVFFSKDGKINNMGYLLKPDSRNIDKQEFTILLREFAKQYTFPITYKRNFYHYTGVTFPTFSEKTKNR